MSENRLPDYIDHMQQAASDACSFVAGLSKSEFMADKRTQQAVVMSLIIIGEAATKVMGEYAEFANQHAEVPWRSMRGMRNRIAHGYFDINLDVVWDTVQKALPDLLKQLPALQSEQAMQDEAIPEAQPGRTYIGKIVSATTPDRVLQDTGRGKLVAHHVGKLDCIPAVGASVEITYNGDGDGKVLSLNQSKDIGPSR